LTRMRTSAEKSEFWLGSKNEEDLVTALEFIKIIDYMSTNCIHPEDREEDFIYAQSRTGNRMIEPEVEDELGSDKFIKLNPS